MYASYVWATGWGLMSWQACQPCDLPEPLPAVFCGLLALGDTVWGKVPWSSDFRRRCVLLPVVEIPHAWYTKALRNPAQNSKEADLPFLIHQFPLEVSASK